MRKICCLAILLSFLGGAYAQTPAVRMLSAVPQGFEPNQGQADRAVDFTSHGPGYTLSLTAASTSLQLVSAESGKPSAALRFRLVGANREAASEGDSPQEGKSNYFLGNDPKRWLTNIPQFGRVQYRNVYPGIDVAYHGNNSNLEYDFLLSPHADPGVIRLAVDGADRIRIDAAGDLVLTVGSAEIRERKPVIYQETQNRRSFVEGHYVALAGNQIGFALESYDRDVPLIIDPVVVFSTYFGAGGQDQGLGITLDSNGNIYMCGPVGAGSFQGTDIGTPGFVGADLAAYVLKVSPSGSLISSTFIAGSNDQAAAIAVAVDGNGNIYLAGNTTSASFPTVNPIQKTYGGAGDIFALELNSSANALIYSTYLGGNSLDAADGIGVDSNGNTLVSGWTISKNFPVANAAQSKIAGSANAIAAKIAPGGGSLVFSTYFGGSGADYNNGMTLDASGDLIFYGDTTSTNFPVKNAFQPSFCGWTVGQAVSNPHGWVATLSPTGAWLSSTYICGSAAADAVRGAAVDASGNVVLTGSTASLTYPTLSPVQSTFGGGASDAFLTKLSPAGTLLYSTYLGGSGTEVGRGVALDHLGNVYLTGNTTSANFPTVSPTQKTLGGADDAFLTKINAAGSAITFSTYLGGTGEDYGDGIAVDGLANAYIAGQTASANFPTASPLQSTYGGGASDAFLTVIATCGFTFSNSAELGFAGGTETTTITTTPECGWTAVSDSAWITITSSPVTGTGSGSVTYSVAANSGGPRTGTLTIGGQTVSVPQYGLPVLAVSETSAPSFTAGQSGATYTVLVSDAAATGPTSGAISLTQTLPAGLTLVSMAGTGWSCTGLVCIRGDVLAAGASYPAVTVTVNVAANAGSPLVAQVSASGGGALSTATASDTTTIVQPNAPVLSVTETNAASFTQGQTGAIYTVTVSDGAAAGPTSGTVTLTQTLPTGLTLVSMTGTGWSCTGAACTRSDALSAGASYPAVTVTVNVAANASSPLAAQVSVSGGGTASNATATDNTTILPSNPAVLSVVETNAAGFTQGQAGAAYTVIVSNGAAAGPTLGAVTLTQTLPAGLTLVSMTGVGWSCTGATCTRSDALAAGASYPAVTVTVNVAANAVTPSTAQVSVSGGGSATATGSDVTTIEYVSILSLTNQGPDAMSFVGFQVLGLVGSQTTNCPATIGVNATCNVTMTFAPNTTTRPTPLDWAQYGTYSVADQQLIAAGPSPGRIVFMGDSVTLYWDQPAPYGAGSLQSVQPFVNRGIVGQTTEQMLVRFWEDAVKLNPAVIQILGGTNDLGGNSGPETNAEIMDQIESMTEVAQANGIKVMLASITPVVNTATMVWTDRRPNATIVALNQMIQAYCQQTGAIYVDYYSVLVDPTTGNMNVNLTVDGLHPNTAGYALMVPVAMNALSQLGY